MVLPISVLALVTTILDILRIPYVLVGSFASSAHGLYRSTGNQWNDVAGILAVMRDGVDAEYLRNWAERLGVDDLLHKALDEVESQG
ncbi:MAG TPA: hypothetical protein VFZ71_12955 [Pyrinomonadaceae bacterium]